MKRIAIVLLACLPVFAVGTVGVSINPLGPQNPPGGSPENRIHIITITWVGDSVTGTVPATVININQFPQLSGYRLVSIEIQPGTPNPSANYSITLTDAVGVDILSGNGANLSATAASYVGSLLSPPLIASPTFNLSGNSVASAKGTINLYFAPLSQVAAARGLPATLSANNNHTGVDNFKNENTIRHADQFPGATADIQIINAIADGPASGVVVDARGQIGPQTWASNIFNGVTKPVTLLLGKYVVTVNVPQTPNSFVRIIGDGIDATALNFGFASGCMFSTVNASKNFELASLTVDGSFVTRTSGFAVCAASNAGYVHDLKAIQPYGIVLLQGAAGNGAQGWVLDRIVFTGPSNTVHQGSQFSFGGGDGSAIADTYVSNITELGGYVSIPDAPQVLLDTGIDTMKFVNFDVGYSSAIGATTQPVIKIQHTGATFAPRWVRFLHISPESGQVGGNSTADCFTASDGNHILIQNSYFVHCGGRAITLSAGSNFTIENSVIGTNASGGLYLTGTTADVSISGNTFSANSVASTNTTDDIQIAAGTQRFTITKNHFNKDIPALNVASSSRYAINLLASTTTADFYIEDNDYTTSALGTGFLRDPTVGFNKVLQFNEGTLALAGNVNSQLWMLQSGGTKFNWMIACQQNLNNACEVTPSTAAGGTTFTNPAMSFGTSTGAANSATINANGNLVVPPSLTTASGAGNVISQSCSTSQRSENAADSNLLTCAIPATAGNYRLRFSMDVSAANAATFGWTATWTDSNGTGQAPTNLPIIQAGINTWGSTLTSGQGNYYGYADISVNNAGTSIVVKLTFSGTSFTAKASATVERII